MSDRIRVLRVLEYEGDRDWVEGCLKNRWVRGEQITARGIIREGYIGVPTVLSLVPSPDTREIRDLEPCPVAPPRGGSH